MSIWLMASLGTLGSMGLMLAAHYRKLARIKAASASRRRARSLSSLRD